MSAQNLARTRGLRTTTKESLSVSIRYISTASYATAASSIYFDARTYRCPFGYLSSDIV